MVREEEMWKSVENEHGVLSKREAFVALTAMEWADKTMIKKACKWLEDWDRKTMYELSMILGSKFIEDFCKAMEE